MSSYNVTFYVLTEFQFISTATEIPNVGKVELFWVNNTPTAAPAAATTPAKQETAIDNDVAMGEHANGSTDHSVRSGEVDYDVADDEDRWMAA
jgi:hypothetical protein